MARIAIADNTGLKFSQDIKQHWEKKGHEVKFERGASEHLCQWADLYYVDWADNNIHYLYDLYHGDPRKSRPKNWDNKKKPMFVVRAIDWDVWIGHARDQNIVSWVDKWITIAPHIERKLRAESEYREGQLKLIRPGVNLERFPPKKTKTDGLQVGMVLGDMWTYKNPMGGLEIFNMLVGDWKLHVRGQHEPGEFNPIMWDHYVNSRDLADKVELWGPVNDMNEFYDKIDVLLVPCFKEAFNYGVGEAMAKGIRPVINNFYGAKDIWPSKYLYNNYGEALRMITSPEAPEDYREYINNNYNIERMMKEYDEFLGT